MEQRRLRLRRAAHRTGVQQGLVPLQAHELELEGRLYQLQGPVQPVQGIEGVKDEGEGRRIGPPLHRHRLHHLREVGGQAQPLQIGSDAPELLEGLRLVEGEVVPVFKQGHVRIDQELGRGGQGTALPAAAPGLDRALAPLSGEHGEQLVRLLVVDLPEHQALGADVHGLPSTIMYAGAPRPRAQPFTLR